jgi:NAD(P)-dependent dehydrogenase (short-subunit alcohol dehydrogenase family)
MERRGGGAIVNIASVAGFTGTGSSMAYAASKAGLITRTRSLLGDRSHLRRGRWAHRARPDA